MNDKELLELAAKAAGISYSYACSDCLVRLSDTGHWDPGCEWRPLTDDGDALRLALSLSFDLLFDCYPSRHSDLHRSAFRIRIWANSWIKEDFDRDGKNAAVRLAIVRAAAQIGGAMP